MKKIRRIAPPKHPKTKWNVSYRPCATGIAIDIERAHYKGGYDFAFTLDRVSYLIAWEQIDAWSKAPRGKLITVKPNTKWATRSEQAFNRRKKNASDRSAP